MANRDLLKEAIADAKAVKETAIANAKAALEEAFTPLMQEKFAKKIAQLDEEELEEAYEVEEGEKEEMQEMYDVEEAKAESTDSMEEGELEELNLEELLRELDDLEEDQTINGTDSETGNEDHGNIVSVNEAEEEEEEEEIDIENMDEDDLKSFIESVIADMVAAGELEGNIEGGEEEEEESEEEVEINERKKYGGNKGDVPASKRGDKKDTAEEEGVEDYKKKKMKENYGGEDQLNEASDADALAQLLNVSIPVANAIMVAAGAAGAGLIGKLGQMVGRNAEKSSMAETNEMEEMKSELAEAYKTIQTIQTELQEVNLFNAKLLYTNKIFKSKNLTESQKVKVLAAFDKAASVKEAKLVFETLSEGMKEKKSPVNESMLRGSASKPAGVSAKKPILEVNDQFARWQTLAGIKK